MVVQKTDQETVVAQALALFRRQGYHQTTMADVGHACGLLKGSLYHYFPGKEALARAVLEHVHAKFAQAVFRWADDPVLSADARLQRMMAETEAYFLTGDGGCVMGNIALETIDTNPEFAPAIRAYFTDWAAALARILACKLGPEPARERAERAVAEIQGAIMMMRVHGNPEAFLRTTRGIVREFTGPA